MKNLFLITFSILFFTSLQAQPILEEEPQFNEEAILSMYQHYLDSIDQTLQYETGTVQLQTGLATLQVPKGYKYLNGMDSEMVLTELWGNPPSVEPSLGMLFPENSGPNDTLMSYAINITYSEEGYIDDSDAKNLDYDELLENMKADTDLASQERVEQGYESIALIGWASAPFYDETTKKIHWAKELEFGDMPGRTLNYNIQVLGRKGYLNLNVIGDMDVLPKVQNNIGGILPSITFNDGNRYADFNPKLDKVAAYGIGGLIAGKVLAKTGLLATAGILLAKFWKILLFAFIAFGAGIKKFLGWKKKEEPLG